MALAQHHDAKITIMVDIIHYQVPVESRLVLLRWRR